MELSVGRKAIANSKQPDAFKVPNVEPAPEWLVDSLEDLNARIMAVASRLGVIRVGKKKEVLHVLSGRKRHQYALTDEMSGAFNKLTTVVTVLDNTTTKVADFTAYRPPRVRSFGAPITETQMLIRQQKLVSSAAFCEMMQWTKQALSKALASNRVFFVQESNKRYFPAFYTSAEYDRRHLEAVSKLLGDLPGSAKLQFFRTGKGSLGGLTPLQALKNGDVASVKVAAEGFSER